MIWSQIMQKYFDADSSCALTQFSLQAEMKNPQDVTKSVWVVGIVQIVVYTVTGALIYAFVGQDVGAPAILSAGSKTVVRTAFGVAMPVIFISGSINANAVARYVHYRVFSRSRHQYINTGPGWMLWFAILIALGVIAFVIAEGTLNANVRFFQGLY